jgi:hypothetical protein
MPKRAHHLPNSKRTQKRSTRYPSRKPEPTKCPDEDCNDIWPMNPSTQLVKLLADYQAGVTDEADVCLRIRKELGTAHALELAHDHGWPIHPDFAQIEARLQGLVDKLDASFTPEGIAQSPVWNRLRNSAGNLQHFSSHLSTQYKHQELSRVG